MEGKTQLLIPKKEAKTGVREKHFHVLAVDDSVIERKMLEKLLTISSYHVTCVESGDKALEYLGLGDCHSQVIDDGHVDDDDHHHDGDEHHDGNDVDDDGDDGDDDDLLQHGQGTRVNLIMTDYSMPGMSGYDLLKRVKESSWKDVPVVVMSSENVPSRIHMCLEEGAEEFLLKPVRLSDLKKLQPRIFKSTSSTTSTNHYCESVIASDLFGPNDNNNSNIFEDQIINGDDHEDYNSNAKEGKEDRESKLMNELEHFAKSFKLDQL